MILLGGRTLRQSGFRRQEQLFDVLQKHFIETGKIFHKEATSQGMTKTGWKSIPIGLMISHMAEPNHWATKWHTLQTHFGETHSTTPQPCEKEMGTIIMRKGNGYNHQQMQNFTRRWKNVLRHSIGQHGKPARCDELGWVSIEEFIRNDHAWPMDGPKVWNYQAREYRQDVLRDRR